jgi:hypothetical protein
MAARPSHCPFCHAPIRRLDDICPTCGQRTGQRLPWHVYGLGGVLVLLLFLSLGNLQGLVQFVVNLGRMFQQ